MRTYAAAVVTALGIVISGCGATRSATGSATTIPNAGPSLTSAAVTFTSREDGKDADSSVSVQLLKNSTVTSAQAQTVGTKFDDHSVAAPMFLAMTAPFQLGDTDGSRLRIHLTPDGRDDWYTDVQLSLVFSGGAVQNLFWSDVRLSADSPDRVLSLAGARIP